MKIANAHPKTNNQARIAFITATVHKDDFTAGVPFNTKGGAMLRSIVNQFGGRTSDCFFGTLDPEYSANKRFSILSASAQIGITELGRQLAEYRPNIVVLIGEDAARFAGIPASLADYRGSLFVNRVSGSPFEGMKCLATLDPQKVLTDSYGQLPLLKFDLKKALGESTFPDLRTIPDREYLLTLQPHEIIDRLDKLTGPVAADIEGYIETGITCIGIAESPNRAFIIPFKVFSPEDTAKIVLKMREVFRRPDIQWIYQHALFDTFALAWVFSIVHGNIWWDTMVSGFELYPELPKSLGLQTSLYTNEPFYKDERTNPDLITHFRYCCKDACVTHEIALKHAGMMNARQRAHFEFNMATIPPLLYCQLRGMAYDQPKANELMLKLRVQMDEISTRINTRLGKALNINSPKQVNAALYDQIGLPTQHPPKKTGYGIDKTRRSSGVDQLLNLAINHNDPIIYEILGWRKLEKMRISLAVGTNPDGRVRCEYNPVGTETNRLSCKKSATGSGTNLQTVTKKLRPLYSVGPGISQYAPDKRYFFQVDLAGADGWTVAAHCNAMGDPTMLEDYRFGIKPARVIGLMYTEGAEVSKLDRATLHNKSKAIGEGDTEALYFICKQVQHGTNYQLGPKRMVELIAKMSWKIMGRPVRASVGQCSALQELYLLRYKGVKAWQAKIEHTIKQTGMLGSASGHTRTFFGRRYDADTLRKALAQEPQHNTTYATNRALINLWNDPENRNPDGSLIIEPLHQVHDALNGSFPESKADWAVEKILSYFRFTIPVAGQNIAIPFEGEYGDAWGHVIANF